MALLSFPFYGSAVEDWWLFPVPKSDYDSFLFSKVSSYRSWVLRVTALGSWLGFDLGFSFCREFLSRSLSLSPKDFGMAQKVGINRI